MPQLVELNPPKWTPFVRSRLSPDVNSRKRAQALAKEHGIPYAAAKKGLDKLARDEIWLNSRYQVNIDREPEHGFGPDMPIVHCSVKRIDKLPIHDWRDLQRIKNELFGPEFEAIELYPAESRVVDTANQYHLWVLPEGQMVPVGWTAGMKIKDELAGGYNRAGQRGMED
jgi:hypothetical protein